MKVRFLLALALGVAALGFTAPSANADGIELSAGDRIRLYNSTGNGSGGEFKAELQELSGSSYVGTGLTWQTFCLETDEYFSSGGLQRVKGISDTAYGGGSNTNSGDPISFATAWLYTQFWEGTLVGLNDDGDLVSGTYTGGTIGSAQHAANATHLQEAIWYLEGEDDGVNNKYVALANAAGWTSIGDVRVMNLERWTGSKWVQAQDQLFMYSQPVPEPGTWALFGLGAVGLAVHRRRRSVQSA